MKQRNAAGQYRKVCAAVPLTDVSHSSRSFFYDHPYQDVTVSLHPGKFFQRQDSSFIQFYIRIHCQKHRKNVRKSEPSKNTASHCSAVSELYSHNMSETFFHRSLSILLQSVVSFQFSQSDHCSDPEFLLILFNRVQSQSGQIYSRPHIPRSHFQPYHSP